LLREVEATRHLLLNVDLELLNQLLDVNLREVLAEQEDQKFAWKTPFCEYFGGDLVVLFGEEVVETLFALQPRVLAI